MASRLTGMDIARAMAEGADEALEEIAERVLRRAEAGIGKGNPAEDPDPEFALAERGRAIPSPGGLFVTIHFPGPYAARHELNQRLDHPRGGGHSYLRNALKAEIPGMDRVIASKVQARTRRAARLKRGVGAGLEEG